MTDTNPIERALPADQPSPLRPLFDLGQMVATRSLLAHLETNPVTTVQALVRRHVCGDFGELCAEDRQANLDAIKYGSRILSAYTVAGEKVYVITEGEGIHRVTTALLSQEY